MEEKPRPTPYPLRMPEDLREKLEVAAKNGSRSLHAEVIARLEASFEEPAHGVDRDAAIASSTAEAMLKALDRANEHGKLLLKKVEAIEARLIQPEGTSLLKTGTPSLSPSQENPFEAIRKPQAPPKTPAKKPA